MRCPKCSAEIQSEVVVCPFCGAQLAAGPSGPELVIVRTSRLAIAALVLGVLSVFTVGVLSVPAVILGIVALSVMDPKGGRVTGHGLATAGIVLGLVGLGLFILASPLTLARKRGLATRMVCGTNLSRIGKAMLIYANDYEDGLPRAGGRQSVWTGRTMNWKAPTQQEAFGLDPNGYGGEVTVSASLYLLVKYAEVAPKSFLCIGEDKTKEFVPRKHRAKGLGLTDVWDFGPEPLKHCSYTYHTPYGQYALTVEAEPGMAVAADRNPWQASRWAKGDEEWELFDPNRATGRHRHGNAPSHHNDGQNVLFLDSHVEFAKRPTVGINDDNIYTSWDALDISRGVPPTIGSEPADKTDSLLVHDGAGTVRK